MGEDPLMHWWIVPRPSWGKIHGRHYGSFSPMEYLSHRKPCLPDSWSCKVLKIFSSSSHPQFQSCALSCACPHSSSVDSALYVGSLSVTWESPNSQWSSPWLWELCSPRKPSLSNWEHHSHTMLGRVSCQWTCGRWCCSNALLDVATWPMFSVVYSHSFSNTPQPTRWLSRSTDLSEGDSWC